MSFSITVSISALDTLLTLPSAVFLAQLIPNTVRVKTLAGNQIYLIQRNKFIKWGEHIFLHLHPWV